MGVETDNDRLAFLSLDDFGIEVEINGRTIQGVFDNAFDDALGMAVDVPVITVRTIDVESDSRGDTLYIGRTAYTIAEKQPDGQGITHLVLQKT